MSRFRTWALRARTNGDGSETITIQEAHAEVSTSEDDVDLVVMAPGHLTDAEVIGRLEVMVREWRAVQPRRLSSVPDPEDAS